MEVQYAISGSGFKTQLPVFKGGSAKELLHFLNEFQGAKTKLGYTTYQKLESGIKQLLQGTAKDKWSTVKSTVQPNTNTVPMTAQAAAAPSTQVITHFSCQLTFSENYATGTNKIKQAKYESISPKEVAISAN